MQPSVLLRRIGGTCLAFSPLVINHKEENAMKRLVAVALGMTVLVMPAIGRAADPCPGELAQAKAALTSAQAALKKAPQQTAKAQDIQAPRAQAGARSQDLQAPRAQDLQAPRSQDIQAPRAQDIQAPRSQQEVPVPRGQSVEAPRVKQAGGLIRESEAACKKGDMALSRSKAREALSLLGK
jgi:hypothetical protein